MVEIRPRNSARLVALRASVSAIRAASLPVMASRIRGVPVGLIGVVADHEPLAIGHRAGASVATRA